MHDYTQDIFNSLQSVQDEQKTAQDNGLLSTISAVQSWQCKRLLASYQKHYAVAKFTPAFAFFINELYGPKDFSQRDNDITRVVHKLAKLVPEKALKTLASALYLNELSFALDAKLALNLNGQALNRDSYYHAYQYCNNQTERHNQVLLLETLCYDLAEVIKIRGISMVLRLSRQPAKIAGVHALYEFVDEGFNAFKRVGKVEHFIQPIVDHEQALIIKMFDKQQTNPLPQVSS